MIVRASSDCGAVVAGVAAAPVEDQVVAEIEQQALGIVAGAVVVAGARAAGVVVRVQVVVERVARPAPSS